MSARKVEDFNESSKYNISCPLCRRLLIKSSESDSELRCGCGATYNIWVHNGMICISQVDVLQRQGAVQVSRLKKYAETLAEEYAL